MTGNQSRLLKVGDRVCWGTTTTDQGTVIGTSWNGVTISWDDGDTNSVGHNDMAKVERVPLAQAWATDRYRKEMLKPADRPPL
jgi:hypothetical protein